MATIIFNSTEISGLTNPTYPSAAARKKYVDDQIAGVGAGTVGGHMVSDIGSDYTYGISGLQFVSSQRISGGTILGHLPSSNLKTWFDTVYESYGSASFKSGWALVSSTSKIEHNLGALPTAVGVFPSGTESFGCAIQTDENYITVHLSISGSHCVNWHAGGVALAGFTTEAELTDLLNDNYVGSSNVNRALIDTISGNLNTRIDALGNFDSTDYITSTNSIIRFADSSNINFRFYPSSLGKSLYNFSANKSLYADSSNVRFRFQASSLSYQSYQHSSNQSIHSFNIANYIISTTAIGRFYPSTTGKATSGSLQKLWLWSSNKSWYAQSSNVAGRFYPSTSGRDYAYKHSANTSIHAHSTTNIKVASVSSARCSGQWRMPVYDSLTVAGTASTKPFQIICTSGNTTGTWCWVSIYNGSSYQWNLLTYANT